MSLIDSGDQVQISANLWVLTYSGPVNTRSTTGRVCGVSRLTNWLNPGPVPGARTQDPTELTRTHDHP
jgi:hypothetical protein